jgi:hypothetical protein
MFLKRIPEVGWIPAHREAQNARFFELEDGWRSPRFLGVYSHSGGMTLAYEHIEGETLDRYLARPRRTGEPAALDLLKATLAQHARLSQRLTPDRLPLVMLFPVVQPRMLSAIQALPGDPPEQDLAHTRESLRATMDAVTRRLPGFSFDRHARNIIIADGQVFQVDPTVIMSVSPILDLALTLRRWHLDTDPGAACFLTDLAEGERIQLVASMRLLDDATELRLLEHFRELHDLERVDTEELSACFRVMCIYAHLLYLGRAVARAPHFQRGRASLHRGGFHALSLLTEIDGLERRRGAGESSTVELLLTAPGTQTLRLVARGGLEILRQTLEKGRQSPQAFGAPRPQAGCVGPSASREISVNGIDPRDAAS